ncbi:uncharacterized protein A1O9_02534 [Exophiala aquamarina CBS 119918]|uniref:Enoyl reductase (ER) domain-containing protein n=1 Tax=Exophiala aquamarina CBS 119918 TaxID=1182545 RepID=A0A072PZB3_9EURO|nr:uncharacterized protein A1O9_02534 [Exophiala aquamarina CBS 119918]KEF60970.1 hypothetical protein A1O9_02534 [Exophiala aquamarina CBS 119918]
MKALVVTEVGKPLTLITNRQIHHPGPSQVQIRVTVAGVNPHDQKCRDRGFLIADRLPAVLANDIVGRVTASAEGVAKYSLGDRIFTQGSSGSGSTQNGLQQYALVDVDFSAKIPASISDDEAATLPSNLLAPVVAFFHTDTLNFPPPWTPAASRFDYASQTVLIIGGGSNCGRLGVQVAALAGIGRIVVVGGEQAELESYGATHVLSRHGSEESILARVYDVVGDDLVYAYDAVNDPSEQHLGVNALSYTERGALARLVTSGPPDDTKIRPKPAGYDVKNVYGSSHLYREFARQFWDMLPGYLVDGKIKPLTHFEVFEEGLDADKVNEVLDGYRDGKRVVQPHFHVSAG